MLVLSHTFPMVLLFAAFSREFSNCFPDVWRRLQSQLLGLRHMLHPGLWVYLSQARVLVLLDRTNAHYNTLSHARWPET